MTVIEFFLTLRVYLFSSLGKKVPVSSFKREGKEGKFGVNFNTIFDSRLGRGGGGGRGRGFKLGSAELYRSKRIVIARKPQSILYTDLNQSNSLNIDLHYILS